METRNVKRKTNDSCAPLPKKWGRWICRCVCCQFFFWAVEDQRCGEALELGGHGHRNPPRCHADTRSDLDHDSGIPLQISTEIRTMYPNHVKRWGPHPERCPRLSRQAGQQGILTEPHVIGLKRWCSHTLLYYHELSSTSLPLTVHSFLINLWQLSRGGPIEVFLRPGQGHLWLVSRSCRLVSHSAVGFTRRAPELTRMQLSLSRTFGSMMKLV